MIGNATPTMQAGLRELGEFYGCSPALTVQYDTEDSLYLFRALAFMSYSYERGDGKAPKELRTPLGKLACRIDALHSSKDISFDGSTCDDSEPSFIDSLYRLQDGLPQTHTPVLYVGTNNQPIAYGKGMGSMTTLYLQHSAVTPELPPGTIVTNQSNNHRSDKWLGSRNARSDKVDGLDLEIVTIKKSVKAEIARASIFCLTPEYVKACDYRTDNLGYAHDATSHSLQDIRGMVNDIAREAGIY